MKLLRQTPSGYSSALLVGCFLLLYVVLFYFVRGEVVERPEVYQTSQQSFGVIESYELMAFCLFGSCRHWLPGMCILVPFLNKLLPRKSVYPSQVSLFVDFFKYDLDC